MYNRGKIVTTKEKLEIYNWCNDNYEKFENIDKNKLDYCKKINITNLYKQLPNSVYNIKKRIEQIEQIEQINKNDISDVKNDSKSDIICIIPYNTYLPSYFDIYAS